MPLRGNLCPRRLVNIGVTGLTPHRPTSLGLKLHFVANGVNLFSPRVEFGGGVCKTTSGDG